MNEKNLRWHLDVLALHNTNLYNSLIYEANITSGNLKTIEFEDQNGYPLEPLKGFFALKDKMKYWLDKQFIEQLPLKVGSVIEELKHRDDVVTRILKPKPFRIYPSHSIEVRDLVDDLAPFEHSNPDHWTLMKIIGLMGFVGKTFLCVSSMPNFGKSSIFDVLHALTDKSPVFKPRSVPGVLNKINSVGNLVFDDVLEADKQVRNIMEEFCLQIAGGKTIYINGAMKSANTKNKYDCQLQSITYLYNEVSCYKDPEKKYFENMFENNKAMDDRFLKVNLKGDLLEKFSRDFNMEAVAEENKMSYVNIAKELLYLQESKKKNEYARRYKNNSNLHLKGRRRLSFNEVTWLVDQYCSDQEEYDKYVGLLDTGVVEYKEMVANLTADEMMKSIPEEVIR